jgi:hypothetical protein
MIRLLDWLFNKIEEYKRKKRYKKKLKELQKRDPFVYKH